MSSLHAAAQIGDLVVDALEPAASCCASPSRSRSKIVKSIWPWIRPVVCDSADAAAQLADVAVDADLGIEARAVGALLLDKALALAVERKIIGARCKRAGKSASGGGCARA